MSLFQSNSKSVNKNNGSIATLENFSNCKKEGFVNADFYNNYNYRQVEGEKYTGNNANASAYSKEVVTNQIDPLLKQSQNVEQTHGRIQANFSSLISDYDKMVILRDQLNEVPPFEQRTLEVGMSSGENTLLVDVPNVDMSYQRISFPELVDSTNEAAQDGSFSQAGNEAVFTTKVDGKTVTVTKKSPVNGQDGGFDGWPNNLKINYKVETIPDKKYFHHSEDWELGETRKNQREKHMADTKELLLYTNQFYIIGTITTALALIFAYKNYGV